MLGSQSNTNPSTREKLPILIVAYCRASLLSETLKSLQYSNRRVYVSIDKAPQNLFFENSKVIECAKFYQSIMGLKLHINESQAGVKLGVPQAIDWIFEFEDKCIILEDDCVASEDTFTYFDIMVKQLNDKIAIVSGDSPWSDGKRTVSSLSKYPLIWGWATSKSQWSELKQIIGGEIPLARVFTCLILKPQKILPVAFFLAAQIRVKRGTLQAWDCSVALEMILTSKKCIIPNARVVENVGFDEYAHHTLSNSKVNYSMDSDSVSAKLDQSLWRELETDRAIRKIVYGMKWYHILSPLKSLVINK